MSVQFSQEKLDKVNELISHYPEGKQKSALLGVLHIAQEEFGWLDVNTMDYVATLLHIAPIYQCLPNPVVIPLFVLIPPRPLRISILNG